MFVRQGANPGEATAAIILVHGRGGSAQDMLGLGAAIDRQLRTMDVDTATQLASRARRTAITASS